MSMRADPFGAQVAVMYPPLAAEIHWMTISAIAVMAARGRGCKDAGLR